VTHVSSTFCYLCLGPLTGNVSVLPGYDCPFRLVTTYGHLTGFGQSRPVQPQLRARPGRLSIQLSFAIVRGGPMGSLALRIGLPRAACHVMDLSRGEIRNETIDILRDLVFGFDRRM